MRLSRIITAVAVGLAVSSLPAAAASAQPYPPALPSVTATDTTVQVGETVTIIGQNFGPNETVDIVITVAPLAARAPGATNPGGGTTVAMAMGSGARQLPQRYGNRRIEVVTNAEGDFRTQYTPRYPGQHTLTATGRESGLTATFTLTVLGRALPVTGDDVSTPLVVGGGLLGTGVLLMLVTLMWRRRSRRRGTLSELEAVR